MKKRIIALSVVSILGTLGLSGCKDVTKSTIKVDNEKHDVIVAIGSGADRDTYTADELFGEYLNTSSGASAAFNAVYDVLIGKVVKDSQEINNKIDAKVTELQEQAESQARTNGSTYKEELSNLLESENVDDLDEYKKKVKLSFQKEKFEEDYYEEQIYSEKDATVDTNTLHAKYIENENPYHVRHILVKVSASGSNFFPTSSTITAGEAKNLANVVKNLASPSMTFGNVAEFYSEDGSSSNFGSLNELMGRKTSYVNEFKFAVFGYDAYVNGNVENGAEKLGIKEEVADLNVENVYENSIGLIPFSVADQLLEYAEKTKPNEGTDKKYEKAQYYPRNVLFNEYFSNHGLSFIENDNGGIDSSRTTKVTVNGVEKEVLADNGRPILVTRAGTGTSESGYQGVHFILVENSPLVNEATGEYSLENEVEYYSTYVPKTNENVSNDKRYVTFVNTDKQTYSSRAKEIESAVKSYNPNIKFELYRKAKSIIGEDKITIAEEINESIEKHIEYTENRTKVSNEETYENSWKTYIRLLQTQNDFAEYKIDWSELKGVYYDAPVNTR